MTNTASRSPRTETTMTTPRGRMVTMTDAALRNIEEAGLTVDTIDEDITAIRTWSVTPADLLHRCLDGADDDRVQGWEDYVDEVVRIASVVRA